MTEIVDAQVHLNMIGIEAGIVAMDAAGVDALVIDEFWGFDEKHRPLPSYPLPGGSARHVQPTAELAVAQHPSRFAFVTRAQTDDPELDRVIGGLRERPGAVGLRILPYVPFAPSEGERPENDEAVDAFARELIGGRFDRYFELAEDAGIPVFLQVNGIGIRGRLGAVRLIAEAHPRLPLVLDHMGVSMPGERGDRPDRFDQFAEVCALAPLPNVSVKWGHATRLSETAYPFPDVRQALRRVVAAFGAERVMWASDWTLDLEFSSWAESFGYIRDDDALSPEERALVLGGTVRRILDWPRA